MSDDSEVQSLTNRMDDAFCARMRAAIDAGLESAPIGVVTTPGTKNPRYLPTPASPRTGRMDFLVDVDQRPRLRSCGCPPLAASHHHGLPRSAAELLRRTRC